MGDVQLRYRSCVTIEQLGLSECTIRRASRQLASWWMLWFYVKDDEGHAAEYLAVAVNPHGGYLEHGNGRRRTWGFQRTAPGIWSVSPSINVLPHDAHPRLILPGVAPPGARSSWHHTPDVVDVPEGEPWALRA